MTAMSKNLYNDHLLVSSSIVNTRILKILVLSQCVVLLLDIGAGIRIGDMGQRNSLVPLELGGMHLEADSMHLFIKWWSRFFIANDGITSLGITYSNSYSAVCCAVCNLNSPAPHF